MAPAEIEEERRTCYVGITRAEEKLYLSRARFRMLYGKGNVYPPSRFLAEIPPMYMEQAQSVEFFPSYDEDVKHPVHFSKNYDNHTAAGNTPQIRYTDATEPASRISSPQSALAALREIQERKANSRAISMQRDETMPRVAEGLRPDASGIRPRTAFAGIKPDTAGITQWQVGDKAKHGKWGIGTVVEVRGTGEEVELRIAFPDMGIKALMQKYAPIQKV